MSHSLHGVRPVWVCEERDAARRSEARSDTECHVCAEQGVHGQRSAPVDACMGQGWRRRAALAPLGVGRRVREARHAWARRKCWPSGGKRLILMLKLHAWVICKPRRRARVTKQFHGGRAATTSVNFYRGNAVSHTSQDIVTLRRSERRRRGRRRGEGVEEKFVGSAEAAKLTWRALSTKALSSREGEKM